MQNNLLSSSRILDYNHHQIQKLVKDRGWQNLDDYQKIGAAYRFVKDEILFGYNRSDDIPASEVLRDGYGQCNTKSTLLMALLRTLAIPCRFHGFTIHQQLQKGAIPSYIFWLAPKTIIHSWVEIFYQGRWINLEGFILDATYLSAVQKRFNDVKGSFCGFGVATDCLASPNTEWEGSDTYIQKEGIHDDFGVYDTPDDFYQQQGTNLSGLKRWLYQKVIRHLINLNVAKIRGQANQNLTHASA